MGHHKNRHVEDRDKICDAQMPGNLRKLQPNCVKMGSCQIERANHVEGCDRKPEKRADAEYQKCEHRQKRGRQIAPGCRGRKSGEDLRTNNAGKDEYQSKKRKLCRAAIARFALATSMERSLGHT